MAEVTKNLNGCTKQSSDADADCRGTGAVEAGMINFPSPEITLGWGVPQVWRQSEVGSFYSSKSKQ